LIEADKLENVVIQVIPFAAGLHPAMPSGFVILDFEEDPSLIYTETGTRSMYLEEPDEVSRHRLVMERLQASALSPSETIRYLSAMVSDLK
jgi:hypothetical protein